MKTILTYGTFDLLHVGHISLLKRAKSYGDHLIVGLSTDEFNLLKNKRSVHSYEHRKIILEAISYIDFVMPEYSWSQKEEDIKKYNVDIFIIGDDWKYKFDDLKRLCEVIYLERTPDISSSKLINILNINKND